MLKSRYVKKSYNTLSKRHGVTGKRHGVTETQSCLNSNRERLHRVILILLFYKIAKTNKLD